MSDERLAAAGPRAAGRREEYEQLLRDIGEGVRLHYGDQGTDPDLALLRGDLLYARGLVTLAQLGDLDATAELADVISLIAAAHAAGDAELAAAVWRSGTLAVGWGPASGTPRQSSWRARRVRARLRRCSTQRA